MSIDNATVKGMDFSALLSAMPDLWMVQWTEGKGEIERIEFDENNEASNLNGLREIFVDVTPYAPLFQQFLTRMQAKELLLPQAKKVQIDVIGLIFESKRQAPFHYPVAAGDFWWDASDVGPMSAKTTSSVADLVAAVNALTTRVNNLANRSIIWRVNQRPSSNNTSTPAIAPAPSIGTSQLCRAPANNIWYY
jgi:hypothetical protein